MTAEEILMILAAERPELSVEKAIQQRDWMLKLVKSWRAEQLKSQPKNALEQAFLDSF